MIPHSFLEDPRIIDKFAALRRENHGDIASIAATLDLKPWQALYAVSFHNAWDRLGLDPDIECAGPHMTYH